MTTITPSPSHAPTIAPTGSPRTIDVRPSVYEKLSAAARRMLEAVVRVNGDDLSCWWVQLPKAARLASLGADAAVTALYELRDARVIDLALVFDADHTCAIVAPWKHRGLVKTQVVARVRISLR